MKNNFGYSIAIPAYGRPAEYKALLTSVLSMEKHPDEVIICEDHSKERHEISKITNSFAGQFKEKNIILNYIENNVNLGYDANIRKLIHEASFKWVILIGNDDLFLQDSLDTIDNFCTKNPDVAMVSRTFLRFKDAAENIIGTSSSFKTDTIIKNRDFSPKYIFRVCGFVGGLIVKREWAVKLETERYDGTLFYQIYLAAHAYCTKGIGYIAKPCVAARVGNPPLFGESEKDSAKHIPGSYSAEGRASMWQGVLHIAKNVGQEYNINLIDDISKELSARQAFHVFEMNVGVEKNTLKELRLKLIELGLYSNIVPKTLFTINYIFGKNAYYFYHIARKIMQNEKSTH